MYTLVFGDIKGVDTLNCQHLIDLGLLDDDLHALLRGKRLIIDFESVLGRGSCICIGFYIVFFGVTLKIVIEEFLALVGEHDPNFDLVEFARMHMLKCLLEHDGLV